MKIHPIPGDPFHLRPVPGQNGRGRLDANSPADRSIREIVDLPPPPKLVRGDLVAQIRTDITVGRYLTDRKLDLAVDRLLADLRTEPPPLL